MFGDALVGVAEGLISLLSFIISSSLVTLGFIGYMLHTGDVLTGKIIVCTVAANILTYLVTRKLVSKFLQ